MQALTRQIAGSLMAFLAAFSWIDLAPAQEKQPYAPAQPQCIRDLLWVWGNPEMTKPGEHAAATFAEASPAQRARLLGVPNVMMAGPGVPNDDQQADAWTKEVADFPRLLWEVAADGQGGPPFVYTNRIAQVRKLVDKYPQIEGVILDDMSTGSMDQGFKAEHIRQIRRLLDGKYAAVKICGVVYTMSLDRAGMNDCINELDVILLAEWFPRKIVELEKHVDHCRRLFPGKPIVLCLYLYDYGTNQRMPLDLLERQFETARQLAHAGRIAGIEMTTINNDPEAVTWTADWIKRVGDEKIGLASKTVLAGDAPSVAAPSSQAGEEP
jgi:hypothetical protein